MHALTEALRDLFHARDFHRKLLKLGLPMALSAILSSSLQIVDTLMIAQLGDVPVAAVGLANRLTYLLSFFISGRTGKSMPLCAAILNFAFPQLIYIV